MPWLLIAARVFYTTPIKLVFFGTLVFVFYGP